MCLAAAAAACIGRMQQQQIGYLDPLSRSCYQWMHLTSTTAAAAAAAAGSSNTFKHPVAAVTDSSTTICMARLPWRWRKQMSQSTRDATDDNGGVGIAVGNAAQLQCLWRPQRHQAHGVGPVQYKRGWQLPDCTSSGSSGSCCARGTPCRIGVDASGCLLCGSEHVHAQPAWLHSARQRVLRLPHAGLAGP